MTPPLSDIAVLAGMLAFAILCLFLADAGEQLLGRWMRAREERE